MRFIIVLSLVLFVAGLSTFIYIESADTPGQRAARLRGCTLCHAGNFTAQLLPCLNQWKHGTALSPMVQAAMLRQHPKLPGKDAKLLAHYISLQQLPLLAENRKTERGAALYAAKCAVCHGIKGEGQPGTYPPLRGSEWLSPSPQRPSVEHIIRNGLQGPIRVRGEMWNSTMLPPGISDAQDIRALLNHLEQFR